MNYYALGQVTIIAMSLKTAIQHYNNSLEYKALKHIYGEYIPSTEDKQKIALEELDLQVASPASFNISLDAWQHLHGGHISFNQQETHNEEDQHNEPYGEPLDSDHPQSKGKPKKIASHEKTTISSLYKYKKLSKYIGLCGPTPVRADTTFIGAEIELEHVQLEHLPHSTWKMIEDGSLKIDGQEFVTIPIQFKFLEVELHRLFDGLTAKATPRCSVHIHINARDFTINELKNFMCLYIVFERSLYNFSGNRIDNNFCTPLSYYPQIVKEFMACLDENIFLPKWYKYFGFNISPLFGGESQPLGTIEFRHMEGSTNIPRILNWINLIVSLKISAKKLTYNEICEHIKTMNTTSGYYWLAEQVFKDHTKLITTQPTFKDDIEHCITIAKDILFREDEQVIEEEIYINKRQQQTCPLVKLATDFDDEIPF
jgi:hypothetical protein